jgi:hypothetical protein
MNARRPFALNTVLAVVLAISVACGPKPTSIPTATPTAVEEIIVTNVIEKDEIIGQIEQTRLFNQCENATSLKTQIQFSQSRSETTQTELVISAGVTGGADIPTVAKIELKTAIEQHFAVENASSQGRYETLDIEVPGGTQKEYKILWNEIRRRGTIEYLEGGVSKFANYSYRTGIELASSTVRDISCLSTPTPSPTAVPTETPTPIPASTEPPVLVEKPIAESCIFAKTWQVDSTDAEAISNVGINPDGCYSLGPVGISASNDGTLQLIKETKRSSIASGIYTPITDSSVIEFDIHVNYLYVVYGNSQSYLNFAVAPANDPMTSRSTTRFKLLVESPGDKPIIFFMLADVGESTGTKVREQHYEHGRKYTIRLELSDIAMRVYINGVKMQENLLIPNGPKVFYIGYNLPVVGGVDVEITNIKIDGVTK